MYQGGEDTGGKRVYIGNVNYEVREEELRSLFDQAYTPVSLSLRQMVFCR